MYLVSDKDLQSVRVSIVLFDKRRLVSVYLDTQGLVKAHYSSH